MALRNILVAMAVAVALATLADAGNYCSCLCGQNQAVTNNCDGCQQACENLSPPCHSFECGSSSGTHCFHADGKVLLESGETVAVSQIKVGDRVAAADAKNASAVVFSEVIAFLDAKEDARDTLVEITFGNGESVKMTDSHLIYNRASANGAHEAVFADRVREGDHVLVMEDDVVVERVVKSVGRVFARGLYSPLTVAGNIIVDGVLASCYAEVDSHDGAHIAMAPLRALYAAMPGLATGQQPDGVHWYADWLQNKLGRLARWHPKH